MLMARVWKKQKKGLFLSVRVYNTDVLILLGTLFLMSPTRYGTAILRCHLSHTKVYNTQQISLIHKTETCLTNLSNFSLYVLLLSFPSVEIHVHLQMGDT